MGDARIAQLAAEIMKADAILIGAGAGLSTSAGFAYAGKRFHEYFSDFEAAYGFHDMYAGGFYPYGTREEFWAYWSRYILCNRYDYGPNPLYRDLLSLVQDKRYFVLTTNVDHQFQLAGFDKQRLFYTQGDYGLFQCSKPCSNETYDNEVQVRRMVAEQKDLRVPSALLPTCPRCGKPMTTNLRSDDTFVEDAGWHEAMKRYNAFVHRYGNAHVLLLELGVGYNTPGIIKYPFWQMAATNPKAVLAVVNQEEDRLPPEIASRSIRIDQDIKTVLNDVMDLTVNGTSR